mgnify:CR=1 FL=1
MVINRLTGHRGFAAVAVGYSVTPTDGFVNIRAAIRNWLANPLEIAAARTDRQPTEFAVVTRNPRDAAANMLALARMIDRHTDDGGFAFVAVGYTVASTNFRAMFRTTRRIGEAGQGSANSLLIGDVAGARWKNTDFAIVARNPRNPTAHLLTRSAVFDRLTGHSGFATVAVGDTVAATNRIMHIRATHRNHSADARWIGLVAASRWKHAKVIVRARFSGVATTRLSTRSGMSDRSPVHESNATIRIGFAVARANRFAYAGTVPWNGRANSERIFGVASTVWLSTICMASARIRVGRIASSHRMTGTPMTHFAGLGGGSYFNHKIPKSATSFMHPKRKNNHS